MPKRSNLAGDARLYLSKNEMLDFQLGRTLSYQHYEGATNGEVARFCNLFRQRGESRDAWTDTWHALGQQCRQAAGQAFSEGRLIIARSLYLRAYNYLRAAEFFFNRVERGADAQRELYTEGVECFDAGIALTRHPPEKVSIPYEGKVSLPAYFFKACPDDVPRPTVIISGGGDGAGEEIYFIASVPDALERGLNVLLFHGPGQRGVMHQDSRCVFRYDTEVWISKVVDYALSRADVDPKKLALYGLSFGGYVTPRAAAFDSRIKALIPNAPIRDFSSLFTNALRDQLPAWLRWLPAKSVIPLLEPAARRSWPMQSMLEQAMYWPTGTTSIPDYLDWGTRFTLIGLEKQISCPVLAVCGEGEGARSLQQAQEFCNALRVPWEFVRLPAEFGADSHCGVNNSVHTSAIVYDWIVKTFGVAAGGRSASAVAQLRTAQVIA